MSVRARGEARTRAPGVRDQPSRTGARLQPLPALLAGWPKDRALFYCDEHGDAPSLRTLLPTLATGPCGALIGPEGGFTPEERAMIRAAPDCVALSLGPRIMRADTAAVAVLALVQSTLGDWQ